MGAPLNVRSHDNRYDDLQECSKQHDTLELHGWWNGGGKRKKKKKKKKKPGKRVINREKIREAHENDADR